jgi:hypothetical protein
MLLVEKPTPFSRRQTVRSRGVVMKLNESLPRENVGITTLINMPDVLCVMISYDYRFRSLPLLAFFAVERATH